MEKISKEYLKEKQYKTTKYLEARIKIHQFTINKFSFHEWIFKNLNLAKMKNEELKILDIGCGTSEFWKKNINNISEKKINLVLTDFSDAMVEKAKKNTENLKVSNKSYEIADIENLEKYKNQFDIVLCHNVVYHADNKPKALSNLHDCLNENSESFCSITTNSEKHMLNVYEIGRKLDKNFPTDRIIDSFTEEKADLLIPEYFNSEKIVEDEILKVTDTEIMMNYVASGVEPRGIKLKENFYEEYKEIVEKEINENGFFKIIKRSPLYICKKKN